MRVTHYFPFDVTRPGGAETHIRNLIGALRTIGTDASIASDINPDGNKSIISIDELRDERFDILHTHGSILDGLPKNISAKSRVHTFHGTSFGRMLACRETAVSFYRLARYGSGALRASAVEFKAGRTADKVICVSHQTAGEVHKYFRVPDAKISVIPSAPPDHTNKNLDKSICKKQLGFTDDDKLVLFVGRDLDPVKGGKFFIQAANRMASERVHFLMVPGDLANSTDRVRAIGTLTGSELEPLYRAADIFVLPSLYEGGKSIALQEAMSFGAYPVTTDLPSTRELLDESAKARFAQPGNLEELVTEINYGIDSISKVKQPEPGQNKLNVSSNWKEIAYSTLAVYKTALSSD